MADVVDVRVGAVPVDGNGMGVQALGREQVGLADHPTEYATRRSDCPGDNGRGQTQVLGHQVIAEHAAFVSTPALSAASSQGQRGRVTVWRTR